MTRAGPAPPQPTCSRDLKVGGARGGLFSCRAPRAASQVRRGTATRRNARGRGPSRPQAPGCRAQRAAAPRRARCFSCCWPAARAPAEVSRPAALPAASLASASARSPRPLPSLSRLLGRLLGLPSPRAAGLPRSSRLTTGADRRPRAASREGDSGPPQNPRHPTSGTLPGSIRLGTGCLRGPWETRVKIRMLSL